MSRESVQTNGTVIARMNRGESSLRVHLLSPEHGRMILIKRISQKKVASLPDIFDEAEITAEAGQVQGTFFLRDYHLSHRRDGIGKRYASFEAACKLATILDKNLLHAENFDHLHRLLSETLEAFNDYPALAQTILTKSLYRMARDEGYPVKEQWFAQLPSAHRQTALSILNTPLSEMEPPPEATPVLDALLHWLQYHTDILI